MLHKFSENKAPASGNSFNSQPQMHLAEWRGASEDTTVAFCAPQLSPSSVGDSEDPINYEATKRSK